MDFDFILFAYWKILSIFSTLSISYRFSSCNTAPMFCIFSVNVWCSFAIQYADCMQKPIDFDSCHFPSGMNNLMRLRDVEQQ